MASTCVLDASAVVRLILLDPAAADWAQTLETIGLVLAPELMLTEVTNTLWKLHRANQLQGVDPHSLLSQATELIDQIEPDRNLQVEALALAMHLNHSVYDCLYLALARREAATLLTADQKLQSLARQVLP
jgi:predicted nucleic acid-binding protein